MFGWRLVVAFFVLALPILEPEASTLTEPRFERRAWGQADAAPASALAIAQGSDGVLWFATANGLYSFDGAHFRRVETAYGHPLRSGNVVSLVSYGDGIAVGYQFGGVSILTPGGARHFDSKQGLPRGSASVLAIDPTGRLYIGTTTGLAVLSDSRWQAVAPSSTQGKFVSKIAFGADGSTWAIIDQAICLLSQSTNEFQPIMPAINQYLTQTSDGGVLAYRAKNQLIALSAKDSPKSVSLKFPVHSDGIFEGPNGTKWAWTPKGTALLRTNAIGQLEAAQTFEAGALPGRMVTRSIVDREGNLWVSTLDGVERYRERRLNVLELSAAHSSFYAARGLGGNIWVASGEGGTVISIGKKDAVQLPPMRDVTAIYRENSSSVWAASIEGLWHISTEGARHWPLPPDVKLGHEVQAIAADQAGTVWVSVVRHGLYRFRDGKWAHHSTAVIGDDNVPVSMHRAGERMFLGFTNGRVAELTSSGLTLVTPNGGLQVGNVLSMQVHKEWLLVAGERGVDLLGLVSLRNTAKRLVTLRGVSGMGTDMDGGLWLHAADGLFHASIDEFNRALTSAAPSMQLEVFNFEDGLQGQPAQLRPLPTMVIADNGRVYYATSSQVGWIDPRNIRRNLRKPNVIVQSVWANGIEKIGSNAIVLGAGTTDIQIQFTATALSIPERVRFRYQLSGVDKEWQSPRFERVARYTNLGPGTYRFQVMAANEDGVWNNVGATQELTISPLLWQTSWFRLGVIAVILLTVIAAYRARVRVVARHAAERAATRIAERERIARSLHDNLLQGVQGLILRCQAVLSRLPKGTIEEKTLGDALRQADELVIATRDEVMDLRAQTIAVELFGNLKHSVESLHPGLRDRLEISVSGCFELLIPNVAREIFQIVHEAISNSAKHSGATKVSVSLQATVDGVAARVLDNGIGINLTHAHRGKVGHWGITSMRERAKSIGGNISISANPGGGTDVLLSVPANTAFETLASSS